MSNVIMAGPLQGFDVPSVLQAVSLSRQHTVLRLWDNHKRETGEIRLKAGQLLDAIHGERRGKMAFHAILRATNHHSFRVERISDSVDLKEPVGHLANLLIDLSNAPAEPAAKPRPAVRPVTPPAPTPLPTAAKAPTIAPAAAAKPRAPTGSIGNVGTKVAELVASAQPLEGLLLAKLPECLLCKSWNRGEPLMPAEALATYVANVAQAHRTCLMNVPGNQAEPTVTLELGTATLMLGPITPELVAVYVFAPGTPLGLVRLVVSQLQGPLEKRARDELLPLHKAH